MHDVAMDSFGARRNLTTPGGSYVYYDLGELERAVHGRIRTLPRSILVLLENLLRREDGIAVRAGDIEALARWNPSSAPDGEISFMPSRVLLQDFTGVPLLVDLAMMRDAAVEMGIDPGRINPRQPVVLVIDHSVQVDRFASGEAFRFNVQREYDRNRERYAFLRWGQKAFRNFRTVPPGTGICHQVNLEHLATVVSSHESDKVLIALPDTLVGTDSHTTMINALGVLGWGVGGIEAEAAMLGEPISMRIPEVVGFRLHGTPGRKTTATDIVLTVTRMLRDKGVVGRFVEFFGDGLDSLSLADRATISNMSPEYGATIGFFPVDNETLRFLRFTGRSEDQVALVEAYTKAQGLFRDSDGPDPVFSDTLDLDMASVAPSIAGPGRPQDRIPLSRAGTTFSRDVAPRELKRVTVRTADNEFELRDGAVAIAAITSCTNTSNPSVMIGAGLLAKAAVEQGLRVKPWVKTSLAPGSRVVTRYLEASGLMRFLEALGFHLVGYGCTTCIGNSGPLSEPIVAAAQESGLLLTSVLSGNRNFEGRISPHVRANYLASPPLVVAYALAGTMEFDPDNEPIGAGSDDRSVFLSDIWPSQEAIARVVDDCLDTGMFREEYATVFTGDELWAGLPVPKGDRFEWDPASTYIRPAPFFDGMTMEPDPIRDLEGLKVLALLGDSVTTDHISPAGAIQKGGPASLYLEANGVAIEKFNSYGSRRGNHEVMLRGTFANIRLRNRMLDGVEGGFTLHPSTDGPIPIYDAAMRYVEAGVGLVVIAGREYGTGSSRDWAAKGTALLGVKAVMAQSFERIHRNNLIGMGVLPVQFLPGDGWESIGLTGNETVDIRGLGDDIGPGAALTMVVIDESGGQREFEALARLDTPAEVSYYRHGGILKAILRSMAAADDV